jgi:hypothetical protein
MGSILIWTEESDFSTYYKRLGPFAKLATSSHFGMKLLAYTLINVREFCGA